MQHMVTAIYLMGIVKTLFMNEITLNMPCKLQLSLERNGIFSFLIILFHQSVMQQFFHRC
ncbi:hypothetical protein D3C72_1953100 [compost metagenome]